MADSRAQDTIPLSVTVSDEAMAAEIATWLKENDASDVTVEKGEDSEGILPFVVFIGAAIAVAGVGQLIKFIKDHWGTCRQLIDARNDEIKTTALCDFQDGKIIVIAKDGVKVEISDPPAILDFNKLAEAALKSGADAVKAAAEAAGASAKVVASGA